MFSSEIIYYLAAIAAACCWSIGPLIARKPVRELGVILFCSLRLLTSYTLLRLFCLLTDRPLLFSLHQITWIALSGFIGVFVGDSCLFYCLKKIGARKTQLIFSLHAPFTAIFAYFIYLERWSQAQFIGANLIFIGVLIAISCKKTESFFANLSFYKMLLPIFIGLLAALSQATGTLLIKPVFQESESDAIAVSTLRIGIAAFAFILFYWINNSLAWKKITIQTFLLTILNGFFAVILGITLVVFALSGGDAGIIATLVATAPVIILPMIWLIDKQRPSLWAFSGALFAVVGCYFLFN